MSRNQDNIEIWLSGLGWPTPQSGWPGRLADSENSKANPLLLLVLFGACLKRRQQGDLVDCHDLVDSRRLAPAFPA